eukprot:TRINITY_DN1641_c0_g1_i1.p1 TRINITY_DN1641_c0_g1~~TRINITY_DN1641_c0_g1_i1.p1  ORF type:complete len:518 (+),score=107.27 TRINITY_DN1641_c0_g1_i1:45-1598(+)
MISDINKAKRELHWKLVGHSDEKKLTKDATNSESWGPSAEQLKKLTSLCYAEGTRAIVMHNLWKRIEKESEGKADGAWKKLAKTLIVLEYLVLHGPEDVVLEVRSGSYKLRKLQSFKHREGSTDVGESVRTKTLNLLELIKSDDRVKSARDNAKRTANRIVGGDAASPPATSSSGKKEKSSSFDDEEFARRLQAKFDKEARPRSNSHRQQHHHHSHRPPREQKENIDVNAVDVAEQMRIMETIQKSRPAGGYSSEPAPQQVPAAPVMPHPVPVAEPSTATWSISPPPSQGGGVRSQHPIPPPVSNPVVPAPVVHQPVQQVAQPVNMNIGQHASPPPQQQPAPVQQQPFDPFAPLPASGTSVANPFPAQQQPSAAPTKLEDFFDVSSPASQQQQQQQYVPEPLPVPSTSTATSQVAAQPPSQPQVQSPPPTGRNMEWQLLDGFINGPRPAEPNAQPTLEMLKTDVSQMQVGQQPQFQQQQQQPATQGPPQPFSHINASPLPPPNQGGAYTGPASMFQS